MKKRLVLFLLVSLIVISLSSLIFAEDFGYNLLEPGKNLNSGTNFSLKTVNASEIWITSVGNANTVNASQMQVNPVGGGTLNIIQTFLTGLITEFGSTQFLSLSGGNANQNIDIGIFDFTAKNAFFNEVNFSIWNGNFGGFLDATGDPWFLSGTDLQLESNLTLEFIFGSTITPTLPKDLVNKDYVDDATSSTAFDFFFSNSSSNIPGHFNMTETDLGRAENTLDSASFNEVITVSVFNWTTLIGQPEFNEIRLGTFDVHIHANKNVGGRTVVLTPKLYNISADGTSRNLLITFESTGALSTSSQEFDLHGTLSKTVMIDEGVRLNLEIEAVITTGGGGTTITVTQEGISDSHLSVQTSSNAFEKIFIRRDGTNTLTGNWQVDSVANPFNINMSGNITADWGFFNFLNISGTILGPGSEFAQYQFRENNFNGSGWFNTTGNITADTYFGDWSGGNVEGNISLGFGDLISEQNPDGADAIRIKGTDYVDVVIGGMTGLFAIWNVADTIPVFFVDERGDTDIAGDATILGDVLVTGNITSSFFFGDGSQLTGISLVNNSYRLETNNTFTSLTQHNNGINATNVSANTITVKAGQATDMVDGLIMKAGGSGAPDAKKPSFIEWQSDNVPTIEGYIWVGSDGSLSFDDTKPTNGASAGIIQLFMDSGSIMSTKLSSTDAVLGNDLNVSDVITIKPDNNLDMNSFLVLNAGSGGGPPGNRFPTPIQFNWQFETPGAYMWVDAASKFLNIDDTAPQDGAILGAIRLHGLGAAIFNEHGDAGGDWRWESNSDSDALFMDAGNEVIQMWSNNIIFHPNGTIIAIDYVDRTPADLKSSAEALQSILSIKNNPDGSLNDSSLSDFVRKQIPIYEDYDIEYSEEYLDENNKTQTYYWNETDTRLVGYEDARSLSNQVTEFYGAIAELENRIKYLETDNQLMKASLCKLEELQHC